MTDAFRFHRLHDVHQGKIAYLATVVGALMLCANPVWAQANRNPPASSIKMRDPAGELSMKIRQPFTIAAVGDMIEMQPFSKIQDPSIQNLLRIMRDADVTVANMEATIVDFDTYSGPRGLNLATREVADDMAAMGIDMVTKANNHTLDGGEQGLWENFRQLERVGIVHAGAGRDLTEARAPRFFLSNKGLVGLAGIYSDAAERGSAATYHEDGFGGVPGNNALHVRMYHGVSTEQMTQLRAMRDSIQARRGEVEDPIEPPAANEGDKLHLFETWFKVMPKPGEYFYEIDAADQKDILGKIRSGKQASDFMVANIHWHQNRFAFQHYSFDHYPAEFEISFAHQAIDAGADTFVGHGVHTIKGVEIYKGKPIFYGLSNFVFQSQIMPIASERPTQKEGTFTSQPDDGALHGISEQNQRRWDWLQKPTNMEALLVTSHFEDGQLTEVKLYPVDLGLTLPSSQMGIPRQPAPDVAQAILKRVQDYSKPFGTTIEIENGVGVIHVRAADAAAKPAAAPK